MLHTIEKKREVNSKDSSKTTSSGMKDNILIKYLNHLELGAKERELSQCSLEAAFSL